MSTAAPQIPDSASPAWLPHIRSAQVRALDPKRHGLIEASAGTGKTFAIEHLVLRLLVENPAWNPEELLLLSFTEKTVAELRDRIRTLLRAQLDDSAPDKRMAGWSSRDLERIRQLWLHADDLSVQTLHAFCQSALRRDPITNNALIRTALTDDRIMADLALDGLLRHEWAKDPVRLERLAEALGIKAGGYWRKPLIRIALKWQPWRHDTLDPECDPGTLDDLVAEAGVAVRTLQDALAAVDHGDFPPAKFRASFDFTPTGKPRKNPEDALGKDPFQKVFLFAADMAGLAGTTPGGTWTTTAVLEGFRKLFRANATVITRGWESHLSPEAKGLPEWTRLAAVCENIRSLCDKVAVARRLRKYGLQAEAARELRAALDTEKIRRGLISYEDMPRHLVEALRRNPGLAPRLRNRYRACIVDEFQDTDPLQWEILEALCLHEERHDEETGSQPIPGPGQAGPARVTPPPPDLPLFLVGDPKQAIYSFRGGDLPTYMTARDRFRAMAANGQAQGVGLDTNHRSSKPLIEALNTVFAHEGWFGPPPEVPHDGAWKLPVMTDKISFTPARAPNIPTGAANAGTGSDSAAVAAPAIVIRDFEAMFQRPGASPPKPRKADVELEVRSWIADRITKAISDGAKPGDFAVLTRGNSEGVALARWLRKRGVPCRIRQRGGPFSGPAADALRLLLSWIDDAASPDAQARILMLPFARRYDEFPTGRPDRCPPLIARWAALANTGQWPEFFTAILHDGGFRERLTADSEAEAARFERLLQILSEAGSAPGTSTRALADKFDAMRRGEDIAESADEGEDEGHAGHDTQSDGAVTVMTLHLSKGLEFRHVFIAATGGGGKDDFLVLRDNGAKGFRIALDTSDSDLKTRSETQTAEENKRLYYVAFTRARETLHVPMLPENFARGHSGPLGGFAAHALRAVAADTQHAGLVRFDTEPLWTGVNAGIPPASPGKRGQQGDAPSSGNDTPTRDDMLTQTRAAFARRRNLTSYSQLALRTGLGADLRDTMAADPLLEEDGSRVQRQEPVVETFDANNEDTRRNPPHGGITAAELPPGAATGTALHTLLEHTTFASVLEADTPDAWLAQPAQLARIAETLKLESVDPACAPAAARAVWNALRAPLPDPFPGDVSRTDAEAPTFRLADLAPADILHEVEFLLSFKGLTSHRAADMHENLPEGIRATLSHESVQGIFLWGFIDLVYRREGRYYLLDWKSNLLDTYDAEAVRASMDHHRYHLQWKLYAVALDRWLSARVKGYDPARHFGGVHYLYLRGAASDRFAGYADRPTPNALRVDYPAEIARLLCVDATIASSGTASRESA